MVSYLMNAMKNFDKTDGEYSLVLIDDLFSFWRSKVKVSPGHERGRGTHVDARASQSIF